MYNNPFGDLFAQTEQSEAMLAFMAIYLGFIFLIAMAFGVISYIFSSKGMYAIAKRRGIEKPWLAWVPVGNMWLLGCISDQFRSLAYGEYTNRRRKLLWLNIWTVVSFLLYIGLACAVALCAIAHEGEIATVGMLLVGIFVGLFVVFYALLALIIVTSVLQYKCYFDLFRSCEPSKSVLYLILSILIGFPLPFFIYSCRNKDLGMPERTQTYTNQPPCEF
jgi:hypothetical protein